MQKQYNFDEIIDRKGTDSVKYDINKAVFGTEDLLSMWVADMDFRSPDFVMEAIRKRCEHEVLGYSVRPDSYFQAQINWFKKRFNWEVEKDWILYSPGVVPAFSMAILAHTQPGDEIIVQPPVYFPFFSAIKDNGRKLVYNQLKEVDGTYKMDLEDLKSKITPNTKMLLFCSPHNPVGRVWTKDELSELAQICKENDLIILSDEIHADLLMPGFTHIPTASLSESIAQRTVTFMAPSKTFNLAALATSSVIIKNPELHKQYQQTLDNIHVGMGNIFGNVGAEAAYTHGENWLEQLKSYLWDNYKFLKEYLAQHLPKIKVSKLEATYLVWLDFKEYGMKGEELKNHMLYKAKLGLNDGEMFGPGGEGFQRINIACPRKTLEKALEQLKNSFE